MILEVVSGPEAGRKVRLAAGQELRVGRTEWADFAVALDERMSSVHFALYAEPGACFVEDLGSSNGTALGGRPVADRTRLADGDEIAAGDTRFVVRIEGRAGQDAPTAGPGHASAAAAPAVPAPAGRIPARFTVEKCSSGVTLCRGSVQGLAPGELAGRIAAQWPLHLIVDFHKLGQPPPADLGERRFLFSWLDPHAAEVASPLVVGASDTGQWRSLIDGAWGNDSVVCFFSRVDSGALLEHFRRSACVRGAGQRGGGVLGYCWPSVLAMLLAHGPPNLVRTLLAGIDAVLVELPDLPDTWQVYGEGRVDELLAGLGLVRQSEPVAAETSPTGQE